MNILLYKDKARVLDFLTYRKTSEIAKVSYNQCVETREDFEFNEIVRQCFPFSELYDNKSVSSLALIFSSCWFHEKLLNHSEVATLFSRLSRL